MYDFIVYIYIFIFFILTYWYSKNYIFISFFSYLILIYYNELQNEILLNSNIYTKIINKISLLWTINEFYINIQLLFYVCLFFFLFSWKKKINKQNELIYIFYIIFFIINMNTYSLEGIVFDLPNSITNFNMILTHTLVSIHPPLIIISILLIRLIVLFIYYNFLNTYSINKIYIYNVYVFIYYLLTFSIILGSFWSINLFGWGGWWVWDPIENISFFYWILLLFFIHKNLQVQSIIFWFNFFLLFDYLFYCTFKLNLLSSLHIFKNSLMVLNINYFNYIWVYYFLVFFFIFFYYHYQIKIKIEIIAINIYYILFLLISFYLYNLIIEHVEYNIYSNSLLNIFYLYILYLLFLNIIKYIYYNWFFLYIFNFCVIYLILFYVIQSTNIIIFFLFFSLVFLLLVNLITYYIIVHQLIFYVIFFLLCYTYESLNIEFDLLIYYNLYTSNWLNNHNIIISELDNVSIFLKQHILIIIENIYIPNNTLINIEYQQNISNQKNELYFIYSLNVVSLFYLLFTDISIYVFTYLHYLILFTCVYVLIYVYYLILKYVHNKYIIK